MKQILTNVLLLAFILSLTGCATRYRLINPTELNYPANSLDDGIQLSVKYDVLRSNSNRRYARKEQKRGIKVIAVKVTNLTDSVLHVGRDLTFYVGDQPMLMMDPNEVASTVKQSTLAYLPYMLLSFLKLDYMIITPTEYITGQLDIGYVLGPGITAGNMLKAHSANKKFRRELLDYDIIDRSIQKGESIYGIIAFRSYDYLPVSVKINK